jgi:hypothetical protein
MKAVVFPFTWRLKLSLKEPRMRDVTIKFSEDIKMRTINFYEILIYEEDEGKNHFGLYAYTQKTTFSEFICGKCYSSTGDDLKNVFSRSTIQFFLLITLHFYV